MWDVVRAYSRPRPAVTLLEAQPRHVMAMGPRSHGFDRPTSVVGPFQPDAESHLFFGRAWLVATEGKGFAFGSEANISRVANGRSPR